VTSRQRFPIGKMIDVGELERATALELLSYHAGQNFTADDADATELCRTLGYHPFALEIAGKTLLVDELTPAEFLRRIADAPHLIETPGALFVLAVTRESPPRIITTGSTHGPVFVSIITTMPDSCFLLISYLIIIKYKP
jgi:hypothetical protein